jgi:hypothetical protein
LAGYSKQAKRIPMASIMKENSNLYFRFYLSLVMRQRMRGMAMEFLSSLMVRFIRALGRMEKLMAEEDRFIKMDIIMKVIYKFITSFNR